MVERMLLKGCRTVESQRDGAVADILMENGRISKMGDLGDCDAVTLNAGGLMALPGLVDCHVHLVLDGSPDIVAYVESGDPETFHRAALENARISLEAGFTHLRDMGCFGFSVAGHQAMFSTGISAAGHMLVSSGGHVRRIGRTVRSESDAQAAVIEQAKGGADFIKAIASGGLLTPGTTPQSREMAPEILKSISRHAGEQGMHLAVHAYGPGEVKAAMEAGARSIEHGYWADRETLVRAASRGTFLVPTLKALRGILDNPDTLPGHVVRNAEEALGAAEMMVRSAVKEGVRLAMGTDAGTPHNRHGENAMELILMHELGLSAGECLAAATGTAAELLGLEGRMGSLAEGMAADIILVSGDPLAHPRPLCEKPRAVLKAGVMVSGTLSLH